VLSDLFGIWIKQNDLMLLILTSLKIGNAQAATEALLYVNQTAASNAVIVATMLH
jgi:hypothetical protein